MAENRSLTSIRGVAALWVVGYHLTIDFFDAPAILPGVFNIGFAGVDLFFVLSGFILMTVHPNLDASHWGQFMLKRIFRVYPMHLTAMLLLVAMVVVAGFGHVDLTANGHYDWESFVPAALLFKWLVPGHGYWNAPSWSLAAEMVCYLALPFWAPLPRMLPREPLWLLFIILGVASCVWLGGILTIYATSLGDAMLNWPGVVRAIWEFSFGVVLAVLIRNPSEVLRNRAGIMEFAACVVFVSVCWLGQVALIPVASALMIAALSMDIGWLARLLAKEPFHWLGRVSFSLYLLHGPIISALVKLPWGRLPLWAITPVRDTVILALSLTLATLTNVWIEEPGRKLGSKLLSRSRSTGKSDGNIVKTIS